MTDTLQVPTPQHPIGWVTYLFGDPYIPGVVTWIGTLGTVVGFIVAIQQLRKATAASVAAKNAALQAARDIGSHEFSAKLTTSLEHLNSAQDQMRRQNADAAAAYLQVAWSSLIDAQNLSDASRDTEQLIDLTQRSRRAIDQIRGPTMSATSTAAIAVQIHSDVSAIIAALGEMSGRVRLRVSGLGSKKQ